MKNELYQYDKKLFDKIKEVGYKSCCLRDYNDDIISTYNTPGTPIQKKLDEIKKRLTVCEPGIYKLMCMYNYGSRGKADTYLIKNGDFDQDKFMSAAPAPRAAAEETTNVLSYKEALARAQELAEVKAENTALIKEVAELKSTIAELEIEIEEMEATPLEEEGAGLSKTLSELATTLLPIADTYFTTKNRQLQLEEDKLFLKLDEIHKRRQPQQRRQQPQTNATQYPDVNDETAVNLFLDEMEKLNDDQLQAALAIIQQENPPLFDICVDAFFNVEEEEQEETE